MKQIKQERNTMKITKSELREMIKEAVVNEIGLEPNNFDSSVEKTIEEFTRLNDLAIELTRDFVTHGGVENKVKYITQMSAINKKIQEVGVKLSTAAMQELVTKISK